MDAAEIERVAARAARIPAQQATSSDRERLRTLEESLRRVVFGQDEAVHAVAQAVVADPGLAAADELVLFLPPAYGLAENVRLLTDVAQTIAPALGWTPGR